MSGARESDESLEQHISSLLTRLPLRRAPGSLQARVLSAIAQREATPWWQHSFRQWPLVARGAFLAISLALAWLAFAGLMWLTGILRRMPWPDALTQAASWAHVAARLAAVAGDTAATVLRGIPAGWLEGAATFGAVLYLALFALGAATYRALYSNR
jgi:hypothetical protein